LECAAGDSKKNASHRPNARRSDSRKPRHS
jgi:hypothetical protein